MDSTGKPSIESPSLDFINLETKAKNAFVIVSSSDIPDLKLTLDHIS